MLSPKSVIHSPLTSIDVFNRKRNDTKDLVSALNIEQRNLYNALKEHSKIGNKEKLTSPYGSFTQPGHTKEYTANRESTTFAHEQPSSSFNLKAPRHSVAGMQSIHYDMINAAKPEKGGHVRDMYSPEGKIVLARQI
jgi:hypothetical protein